ncbi:MAG TPA: superoxide dismutase family protein [Coxiellaceae bacterium]|nr:superoxide dismutase family protein [Coxiellaceae bacterium]
MKKTIIFLSSVLLATNAFAKTMTLPMYSTDAAHSSLGTVTAEDSKYGLLLTPQLKNIPTGLHGFHLHQNPSCDNEGMAAGGHWDPKQTEKHLGPYTNQGHQGDSPAFTADANGNVTQPVLAPRLTVNDLHGHAFILHAGGDNYSDVPEKLGGGGARIGCGVVS